MSVTVHDLGGRVVKEVYSGLDSSGRYQRAWDGTDSTGKLLAPGVYLVRLEIEADSGTEGKTAVVSLVY